MSDIYLACQQASSLLEALRLDSGVGSLLPPRQRELYAATEQLLADSIKQLQGAAVLCLTPDEALFLEERLECLKRNYKRSETHAYTFGIRNQAKAAGRGRRLCNAILAKTRKTAIDKALDI